MGTTLEALQLVMSSVLSTQPWLRDPNVVHIPWRQDIIDSTLGRAAPNGCSNDEPSLRLAIYWTDHVVTPQPPITRGLHMVVDAVKRAGHEVSQGILRTDQDKESLTGYTKR